MTRFRFYDENYLVVSIQNTLSLFTCLLMDTSIITISWLLKISFKQTLECIYVFELMHMYSMAEYLELELLDQRVVDFGS